MNDDELRELLPLAALDALDHVEQAEVDAALAARPELRAELDQLCEAAAQLAPSGIAPASTLKRSVLDEIAVTAQDEAAPATPADADAAGDSSQRLASVTPLRRRWSSLLAVAAAAIALVVGAVVWIGLDDSPDEREQAERIIERPDAASLPLPGEIDGVRVVYSPSSDDAALVADEMPEPGDDRAYQLWFIRDEVPVPANVFRPDDDGGVLVLVEDFRLDDAVLAITEEPAGGSEAPTGDILVSST